MGDLASPRRARALRTERVARGMGVSSSHQAHHRLGKLAKNGNLKGVQRALAGGDDPNYRHGWSPLWLAAREGRTEVVRALCKA
eukprot:COSAG06_NODE_39553_length_411_cov_0.826923_2_plen_83_part_01